MSCHHVGSAFFPIPRQPPVMVHPSYALANKLTATCQGPGVLRHARIAEPSPMASSDTLALQDLNFPREQLGIGGGTLGLLVGNAYQMAGKLKCLNHTCSCRMCLGFVCPDGLGKKQAPAASFPGLPVPNPSSDRHQSLCAVSAGYWNQATSTEKHTSVT